mmetsp:Transcript_10573/g.21288  ORF Transcript_10573/g.21288 Transcript_10573/m.21288 type:complete len:211 (-) Transcript_10573:38-670(-)
MWKLSPTYTRFGEPGLHPIPAVSTFLPNEAAGGAYRTLGLCWPGHISTPAEALWCLRNQNVFDGPPGRSSLTAEMGEEFVDLDGIFRGTGDTDDLFFNKLPTHDRPIIGGSDFLDFIDDGILSYVSNAFDFLWFGPFEYSRSESTLNSTLRAFSRDESSSSKLKPLADIVASSLGPEPSTRRPPTLTFRLIAISPNLTQFSNQTLSHLSP